MSQTICKWHLKFQFVSLNLSSKFPAGVRVRTPKNPYMDMCVLIGVRHFKESTLNVLHFTLYTQPDHCIPESVYNLIFLSFSSSIILQFYNVIPVSFVCFIPSSCHHSFLANDSNTHTQKHRTSCSQYEIENRCISF